MPQLATAIITEATIKGILKGISKPIFFSKSQKL